MLAATPADLIYQSIRNDQIPNIFVVGGTTFVTALLAFLVYSTRIFTNRSVLAAIPKNYIPIGHGEVGRNVRKLILRELHRSALVAWDSRPRDTRNELQNDGVDLQRWTTEQIHQTARRHSHIRDAVIIPISTLHPPWGKIGHAGWSSPASNDLPDLEFTSIIQELPNLIEAKAVSLAPPDPAFAQDGAGVPPIPDERVVDLLRRPYGVGLREYLTRLANLNLINPPAVAATFLKQYEYARFSTEQLSEGHFRQLMATFAELLAGMTELDPALIVDILQAEGAFDSDSSSFAPSTTTSGSASASVSSETGSVRRYETPRPSSAGIRSLSMVTARTAPSRMSMMRQASERTRTAASRQSQASDDSFARTRQDVDLDDDGDDASLSSAADSLPSAQSVVRHSIAPAD